MRLAWLAFLLPSLSWAQERVTGRVLDASTQEPVPYCTVKVNGTNSGTLTNDDGDFAITLEPGDSLAFAMVGYARLVLSASEVKRMSLVKMQPSVTPLTEVEIRPDNDRLYALVAKCASRMRRGKAFTSKAYFDMSSRMDEHPTEVVECFYNARIDGPHLASLELKHGRIGLSPLSERFFVNLNSTKAMCLLDLREATGHFAANPFQWTKAKAIAQRYRVKEMARSSDDQGLVQVRLTPKDTSGGYFTVEAWIEQRTATPRSIALDCAHCTVHPFLTIRPEDIIRSIDIQVRFTMAEQTKDPELQHMELRYDMDFEHDGQRSATHTEAVLNTFDRAEPFLLPVFDYDREQYDYHKILFQPYDSLFWEHAPGLVRTERQEKDREFFAQHGVLTGFSRPEAFRGHHFLSSNYVPWAPDHRLSLRGITPPTDATTESSGLGHVHLEAQLYMDVDTAGPAAHIFTAAMFDELRSYHTAPELRQTDAFLNIFFDLCEMERRRMDAELRKPGLFYSDMLEIHAKALRNMERTTKAFTLDTDDGKDMRTLTTWNDRVKQALGIDNLALIGLAPEGTKK